MVEKYVINIYKGIDQWSKMQDTEISAGVWDKEGAVKA